MPVRMLAGSICAVALLLAAGGGCRPATDTPPPDAAAYDVTLRLLVVDDAALAAAIAEVGGEWKARSGATLEIAETTGEQLLTGDKLPGEPDAVIYPSAMLGSLASRGWLLPLPADYAQHRELAWSDTFELLQTVETRWQQTALAVPLGSPVLTCYYRADLFEKFHRRPPRTWKEYQELAKFFHQRENLADAAPPEDAPWYGCIEPLADGWAARVLLARAAAYSKHRDHYSTLFNVDSMEPLVNRAGYVRALEELAAAAKLGPDNPRAIDLDAARDAILQGRAAMALAWPAHQRATRPLAEPVPIDFCELPGSDDVYNYADDSWESRTEQEGAHVTVLGLSGRLASLNVNSAHPQPAFQLLAWLSGKSWGGDVGAISSASPATTLYRGSQLRSVQPWVDAGTDAEAARKYGESVRDALSRTAYLPALRIPGHDRYLAALDAAVAAVLDGTLSAGDALAQAAAKWDQITNELGRDDQRKAYRQSLGLEP